MTTEASTPSIPGVDLAALHEAIKAQVQAAFPGFAVDYYPRPEESFKMPKAIYLELEEFEPSDPPQTGTEQLEVTLRWSAILVFDYKKGNKLAIRQLAAAFAQLITNNRWGKPVGPGVFVSSHPESFQYGHQNFPDQHTDYETWRVSWTHEAALGDNVWEPMGTLVTEVFAGRGDADDPSSAIAYEQVIFPE